MAMLQSGPIRAMRFRHWPMPASAGLFWPLRRPRDGPSRPRGCHVSPKRAIGILEVFETMLNRRNGYEYEDLLDCGRGEMFGPGNAQLPLPPMLMFDRISEISDSGGEYGKGLVRAELDVK